MLEFNKENHTYVLDGVIIPSVTQLMNPLSEYVYKSIDPEVLKMAAERGTSVHDACEMYLQTGMEDCPSQYIGYFEAFKKWHEENPIDVVKTEFIFAHPIYRYGGTCDLLCNIDGELSLVDYKTTSKLHESMVGVQLTAYRKALQMNGFDVKRMYALNIKKDGTYQFKRFEQNDEFDEVFMELVKIRKFCEKNL